MTMKMVGISSVMHFIVDGFCLCCLYLMASQMGNLSLIGVFVLYNVLAFLTQPLTGLWADHQKSKHWILFLSVMLLVLADLLSSVFVGVDGCLSEMGVMLVATLLGMGNSLFHVWGGQQTAVKTRNDIRALGVFVSTGALGLSVGMLFCSWILLHVLLLSYCVLAIVYVRFDEREWEISPTDGFVEHRFSRLVIWVSIAGIMLFVLFRSFLGGSFTSGMVKDGSIILAIGAISMLGKMAGGWLARYLGIVLSMLLVLIGVVICIIIPDADDIILFIGLFLINCTMPVTLYLANVVMRGREGLAFGLLAAALIPGFLMSMDISITDAHLSPLFLALIPTIIIEYGVLRLLREKRKSMLLSSIIINILTNIPLNLYVMYVNDSIIHIIIAEFIVIIIEIMWYYCYVRKWKQATVYSVLCNLISFLTGLLFLLFCDLWFNF